MPDSEKPTLLVIDGHSLAFRAFYALPLESFVTRDGQHTNAIHGFLSMLLNLLQVQKPTHLAVAFDISRFSFRTREYAEYKGTRGATPPEFIGQVPLLEEALKAMNIATISKEDFEADDILATLAARGSAEGYRVLVVSGDRDTIQLVNDDVTLLYPNVRGVSELKFYDRDAVVERYGIEPAQYPEIAALVGETSDNLPGVDKVGEKTAVKWIQQYGTVHELLAHADEIGGVVGQNLRDQADRVERNRRLNRLVTDVELPVGPADLARNPIDAVAVRAVFERLQFRSLLDRVFKLEGTPGETGITEKSAAPLAAIPPVRTMVDEELAKWLATASANGTQPLGLRVVTLDGRIDGFGIASLTDSAWVPWGPHRPDYIARRLPRRRALRLGRRWRSSSRRPPESHWVASSATRRSAPGCFAPARRPRRCPRSSTTTSARPCPSRTPASWFQRPSRSAPPSIRGRGGTRPETDRCRPAYQP